MMTSAQVVETSVNVTTNSLSQDYAHLDDRNLPTYDMTPGFKPLKVYECFSFAISIIFFPPVPYFADIEAKNSPSRGGGAPPYLA